MFKRLIEWFQDAFANLRGDPRSLEERRAARARSESPFNTSDLQEVQTDLSDMRVSPLKDTESSAQNHSGKAASSTATRSSLSEPIQIDPEPFEDGLVDVSDLDHELEEDFVQDDEEALTLVRQTLIERWRQAISDPSRCWALFSFGSVVMLENMPINPRKFAEDYLKQHRPSADTRMGMTDLPAEIGGWVVFGEGADVLVYVAPEEVGEHASEAQIIATGRAKIGEDAERLVVIHVHIPH